MAVDTAGQARTPLDLKSAQLSVVAMVLKTVDVAAVAAELAARSADDPEFFDNDPVLIDLSAVQAEEQPIDFAALVQLLRSHRYYDNCHELCGELGNIHSAVSALTHVTLSSSAHALAARAAALLNQLDPAKNDFQPPPADLLQGFEADYQALKAALLRTEPPLIGRLEDDSFCLDPRTLDPADRPVLLRVLREALALAATGLI